MKEVIVEQAELVRLYDPFLEHVKAHLSFHIDTRGVAP